MLAVVAKDKLPVTAAIRVLREARVAFTPHLYDWEPRGGTRHSAASLGVDEHQVIKTLVMEDEDKRPLVVLMHGDHEVSTKALARQLGVKTIQPCEPAVADRHSGYQVGGTSPFGTRRTMPIYMQASIAELPVLYINGGKRGFLIEMTPAELVRVLSPTPVDAAIARG
jgi:Cys-tRNA(Pro) deacylase